VALLVRNRNSRGPAKPLESEQTRRTEREQPGGPRATPRGESPGGESTHPPAPSAAEPAGFSGYPKTAWERGLAVFG